MRKSALVLPVLWACAQPPPAETIRYRSTFEGSTKGLVLHKTGNDGHAGMFGTNCPLETVNGTVTGDYDLPDQDEDVQDGEPTTLGDITLSAVIPGTIHVLDKTDGVYTHVPIDIAGVVQGRLTWDGVVGLTTDCRLAWVGLDGTVRHETSVPQCSGSIETDPQTGTTVVTDPEGTVVTDGQTTVPGAANGDLVSFDDVTGAFYVAQRGQSWLAALEPDGSQRWRIETPGPVQALDDGGQTGTAVVVVELENGQGSVIFYDGFTGAEVRAETTPSAADDLSVSENGAVIALVRPEQVFFYEIVAPPVE